MPQEEQPIGSEQLGFLRRAAPWGQPIFYDFSVVRQVPPLKQSLS